MVSSLRPTDKPQPKLRTESKRSTIRCLEANRLIDRGVIRCGELIGSASPYSGEDVELGAVRGIQREVWPIHVDSEISQ